MTVAQVLLFCSFLALTQAVSPLSGSFNTKDGSQCTWFDQRSGTSSNIHFGVPCVCKNAAGESQGYMCRYTGALAACQKHTDDRRAVYNDFVNQLEGMWCRKYVRIFMRLSYWSTELGNACALDSISSVLCPGVEMKRETLQDVSSPCVAVPVPVHKEL